MLYLISYDLTKKPETEYEDLIAHVKQNGAVRILYSEWLMASNQNAGDLLEGILPHVFENDKVWVVEVTTNTSWFGVIAGGPSKAQIDGLFAHARA